MEKAKIAVEITDEYSVRTSSASEEERGGISYGFVKLKVLCEAKGFCINRVWYWIESFLELERFGSIELCQCKQYTGWAYSF